LIFKHVGSKAKNAKPSLMPPERRFGKIQNLASLVLRDFERCHLERNKRKKIIKKYREL